MVLIKKVLICRKKLVVSEIMLNIDRANAFFPTLNLLKWRKSFNLHGDKVKVKCCYVAGIYETIAIMNIVCFEIDFVWKLKVENCN